MRERGGVWAGMSFVAAAFAFALTANVSVGEPRNLDVGKREVRAYVNSGDYEREVVWVATEARDWIEERAALDARGVAGRQKLAVVMDLDETLLSNWPSMNAVDFGYVPAVWEAWVDRGESPAIEAVRDVYRAARRAGVAIIFLTGRTERDRAGTEKNLRAIACADYEALICRGPEARGTNAEYKTAERKRLVDAGYVIVANIGDQESDLAGGFAERTFKLPNPFYFTE